MCVSVATDFPMLQGISCVTFDEDEGIKASQGLWLYNQNVAQSDDDCKSGKCGFFNSTLQSKLELAYFSNAFDRFESFSVSFFFKRSAGVAGSRSLLDNSECGDEGSLRARSVAGAVSGSATNSTTVTVSSGGLAVSSNCWREKAIRLHKRNNLRLYKLHPR